MWWRLFRRSQFIIYIAVKVKNIKSVLLRVASQVSQWWISSLSNNYIFFNVIWAELKRNAVLELCHHRIQIESLLGKCGFLETLEYFLHWGKKGQRLIRKTAYLYSWKPLKLDELLCLVIWGLYKTVLDRT